MSEQRYLIVGGGMTADAACRGIREHDENGSIVLVGNESHAPYKRPPLSKGLWQGEDESSIWYSTDELAVEVRPGRQIVSVDLEERLARDDQGDSYAYERLLFATGGRPRRLAADGGDVVYFRTFDDYRRLRALADRQARFAVVGGGFIGSEIAAALASNGCQVSLVFPEDGIGARIYPAELSSFVTDYYRSKGVDVRAGETVDSVERSGDGAVVRLGGGETLEVDAVVAGLGIEPAVELAEAAGLPVANGIVVDEHGRSGGRVDVFAAGDVARFPVAALRGEMRVEHEDHARSHGHAVGANMAGAETPYRHLPFFYSDLFDLGYEAVGELDSRLETLTVWSKLGRSGLVGYVDGERRPRGFLLWGVFGKVDEARALIEAAHPIDEAALSGLLG